MAGPGGREVGRISIKVVPDTDGFRRDLKNDLEAIEKGLSVEVEVKADTAKALAQIKAVDKALDGLDDQLIHIRVNESGGTGGLAQISRDLKAATQASERFGKQNSSTFGREGRGLISAFIGVFNASVNVFKTGTKVGMQFGENVMKAFQNLGDQSVKTGQQLTENMGKGMQSLGQSVAALVTNAIQFTLTLSAWTIALTTIAGLITYLVGAIGALASALPVLLAGVGLPIAAIAIGFDGIKKAFERLTPEITRLQTTLNTTFEQGFIPIVDRLRGLFPIMEAGLKQIATDTIGAADAISRWATSAEGVRVINNMLAGTRDFLRELLPGFGDLFTALMNIAGTREYYTILGDAFGDVASQLGKMFDQMRASGQLEAALRSLGDLLRSLTSLFSDVLRSAVDFFIGATPGMSKFVTGLGNFLGRFDWERLGTAFGNVFGKLGEWLANVPEETLQALQDSLVRVSDALINLIDSGALDMVINLFSSWFNILAFGIDAAAGVIDFISGIGEAFGKVFSFLDPQNMAQAFQNAFNSGEQMGKSLRDGWTTQEEQFRQRVQQVKDGMYREFVDASPWFFNKGREMMQSLKNGMEAGGIEARNKAQEIKNRIKDRFADANVMLEPAGRGIMGGLDRGMGVSWASAQGWISGIGGWIRGAVSADLYPAGAAIMKSFYQGLKAQYAAVQGLVSGIGSWIQQNKGPLSYDRKLLIPAGIAIMQGLFDGLDDGFGEVKTLVSGMAGELQNAFGEPAFAATVGVQGASTTDTDLTSGAESLHGSALTARDIIEAMEQMKFEIDKYGIGRLANSANRDNDLWR